MSVQLINQYYTKREKLIQFGGSKNELSIRDAFKDLLNHYAEKKNLMLVPEIAVQGTKGAKVKPDGTLKNALRLDYGYWERNHRVIEFWLPFKQNRNTLLYKFLLMLKGKRRGVSANPK